MVLSDFKKPRIRVDGKFFRQGESKFPVRGVTYGPFGPLSDNSGFASRDQTARDFAQIHELGANVVRIYHPPPDWVLDLALKHDLRLLVDVPWNKHLCFLDSPERRAEAHETVRKTVAASGNHPAVFAYSVANEIAPDIVRWSGAAAVAGFIDELIETAKSVAPDCLCTYTNYPPTEFLRPRNLDFFCFNVYLHERQPFTNYLARLQTLAGPRPLLLGEFGMDSLREGEPRKSETLSWQIERVFRGGLAGAVIFSFTDDWYKDGRKVEGWELGLTTASRLPKPSFAAVRSQFALAPSFPLPRYPRVSVVVASYNGDRTLPACLESLSRLNYPDYEVILVDDGSTDTTPRIAAHYPQVRSFRHEKNLGLSVARNTGIAAATGEIVAFTDADCRADEDWLHYLVGDLLAGDFAGIGGPNLLPPEDCAVAAAVMASPGGPTHVLLTDREAEHIPGCNMAFYKSALDQIHGFDPIFRRAGDDVDVCWRLQQAGFKIGFSPAGFVWHYRRSTVRDYLKQQQGYGEAEALLAQKHPENFNSFGGGIWRGRIYGTANAGVRLVPPIIYHGPFGTSWFQTLYTAEPTLPLMLCTTPEYYLLVALPLWVLTPWVPWLLPLALTSLLVSVGVCVAAAMQAELPKAKCRFWSRPLVALLYLLQPIGRGWARYRGRLTLRPSPTLTAPSLDSLARQHSEQSLGRVEYWLERPLDRLQFLRAVMDRLQSENWPVKPDAGWSDYDLEVYGGRWSRLQLTTVAETHPQNRQMIRCRLRARWSLQAQVAFWGLLALELLLIGLCGRWLTVTLITLPAFAWFLAGQKRALQSLIQVRLDEIAQPLGMQKVPAP
ncbi:MAG TPA: glycosyltransferase [Dongiaceae bacterium]|nr:glycosyltransferase [Dongiaceae bacterium]